ncbi:MAG: TetR/AcrR family transcriptional regulator [Bacilli bacterium]|jgi:AcrR family transcriptional regulator|nr:TetR/AcrR family transcriptional regulator [Bacilli bacterium]
MENIVYKDYYVWLDEQEINDSKKNILKSAIILFSQNGYDSTSTSQIAREANVSEGLIFKYFKSKKELKLAIIEPIINNLLPSYSDEFITRVSNELSNINDLISYAIYDRYYFLKMNKEIIIIIFNEVLHDKDMMETIIEKLKDRYQILKSYLNNLLEDKNIDTDSFIRLSFGQLLVYFLQRFHFKVINNDENKDIDLMINNIIRFINS